MTAFYTFTNCWIILDTENYLLFILFQCLLGHSSKSQTQLNTLLIITCCHIFYHCFTVGGS